MKQLWKNARLALEEADEVYIVGYSMPSADATARGLFRESIRPDARVIVVNREPEPIVKEITAWGLKVDRVLDEPNCVEQMVEMLEDRRGKEALNRLKRRFAVGDFDATTEQGAVVIPVDSSSGYQRVKHVGIDENSLVLQECSDEAGALTIPKLLELICSEEIEDIRIRSESAESPQRVVHFMFDWRPNAAIPKLPSKLWLRVVTVPNSNAGEQCYEERSG